MLRVKTRKDEAAVGAAATAGASAEIVGLREVHKPDGLDGAKLAGVAVGGTSGLLLLPEVGGAAQRLLVRQRASLNCVKFTGRWKLWTAYVEIGGAVFAGASTPEARVAATAGESAGNISLHSVLESARSSLCHRSSLARSCADGDESCAVGVASVSAASGVAALPVRVHSRMLVLLRMHVGRWQEVTIRGRTRQLIHCGCRIRAEKCV